MKRTTKPKGEGSPSIKSELLGDLVAQTGVDLGAALVILEGASDAKCRVLTATLKSAYDKGRYDALQYLNANAVEAIHLGQYHTKFLLP